MRHNINIIGLGLFLMISVVGCHKKHNDPVDRSTIEINSIDTASVIVSSGTTFRVSCQASGSAPVQFHWSASGKGKIWMWNSEIKDSFDHGSWTEWIVNDTWYSTAKGTYKIIVLAYTEEGVGSGGTHNYATYDAYGNLDKIHVFYESAEGSTWREKEISIVVQ